jgi:cytoskeletal protein RodZ
VSIGEALATKRQDEGLTVTQVSARTRIRETVIRAIECDDFSMCGGNFYARGHVRSIARVIGLDPEPLVREYDDSHGGAPQAIAAAVAFEPETPVRFRERRSPNWSAAMALALVFVLIYGVVHAFGSDGRPRQPVRADQASRVVTARPAPSPAPVTSAPIAMASRNEVTVRVDARRASWVSVRDSIGKQLFTGVVHAGDTRVWSAKRKIRILIGNGGGVKLTVNGKDLGSPGSDGQVLPLSFGPGDPETA